MATPCSTHEGTLVAMTGSINGCAPTTVLESSINTRANMMLVESGDRVTRDTMLDALMDDNEKGKQHITCASEEHIGMRREMNRK